MPDLTPLQQFGNQIVLFVPNLVGAILLFIAFWIGSGYAARIVAGLGGRTRFDPVARKLITDVLRITILVVGGITALGTIGIDVSALVAGLGLTSLALGLALRDIVSNVVSGLLILMYRPFRLGDTINVTGSEGKVVNIDMRYTTLVAEGKMILVPNQNVFSNVVIVNRPPEPKQVAQ